MAGLGNGYSKCHICFLNEHTGTPENLSLTQGSLLEKLFSPDTVYFMGNSAV